MKEASDHHRISAEGKAMGKDMARLADAECASLERQGEEDERCKSCAFRVGTVPNGCIQTQSDAIKAVVENVPFMCRMGMGASGRATKICHGWFAVRRLVDRAEKLTGKKLEPVPWEFSPPDPKN